MKKKLLYLFAIGILLLGISNDAKAEPPCSITKVYCGDIVHYVVICHPEEIIDWVELLCGTSIN